MQYWTANQIIKQLCGELGLPIPASIVDSSTVQNTQLLAALNASGNDLRVVYPWEQFKREWEFWTVENQGSYDLPPGWLYFVDQTQWDRSNHWPLLGPKTPQEWAWLRGGLNATAPRLRWRVMDNQFFLWPVPGTSPPSPFAPVRLAMEYVTENWVRTSDAPDDGPNRDMVAQDGDVCWFNPWLLIKYTKVKFYQLKQFDTSAVEADFMLMFNSLTGKDVGAGVLSLSPGFPPQFLGVWNVPDGSWNTGAP